MSEQQIALTADEIFAAKDLDYREWVALPEWGTTLVEIPGTAEKKSVAKGVFVRTLSMADRGKIRKAATVTIKDARTAGGTRDVVDAERLECLLAIECAVNSDGRRIFKSTDEDALMTKRSGSVAKIAKVAMRLAGLDPSGEQQDLPSS